MPAITFLPLSVVAQSITWRRVLAQVIAVVFIQRLAVLPRFHPHVLELSVADGIAGLAQSPTVAFAFCEAARSPLPVETSLFSAGLVFAPCDSCQNLRR